MLLQLLFQLLFHVPHPDPAQPERETARLSNTILRVYFLVFLGRIFMEQSFCLKVLKRVGKGLLPHVFFHVFFTRGGRKTLDNDIFYSPLII